MENEDKPVLVLSNGLKIFYTETPEKSSLSFNMKAKINSNDDNKEVCFAMNHLIEHCIRIADPIKAQQAENDNLRPKDCQTYYDRIEYRKQGEPEDTSKILDCYGEMFSNWHMPHIDAERNVIFEEWCHVYNQKDKWNFLTDYFQNENNTYVDSGTKLLTDEYVEKNRENIHRWFNDQINYTQDFSKDDIINCAKNVYAAENMELHCSGNIPADIFLKLVKESTLNKIPKGNSRNPLESTTDYSARENTTSKLDMEDFKNSSVSLKYNVENSEHAKIMKEFLKIRMGHKLQKEEPNAYIVDFKSKEVDAKISEPKQQKTVEKMAYLVQNLHTPPVSDKEIALLQKKLQDQSISPQLIESLVSQVQQTSQIIVNGKNKGFVKELVNKSQASKKTSTLHEQLCNLCIKTNSEAPLPQKEPDEKQQKTLSSVISRFAQNRR